MALRNFFIYLLTILCLVGFASWHFLFGFEKGIETKEFNKQKNSIWISSAWLDTDFDFLEIHSLIKDLESLGVTNVFVSVGSLDVKGEIPEYRYVFASQFLSRARSINNEIQFLAWISQDEKRVNLNDMATRRNILRTSGVFVQELGFDGIHFYPQGFGEDSDLFVSFLSELKQEITPAQLSIAVSPSFPGYTLEIAKIFGSEPKRKSEIADLRSFYAFADQIVLITSDQGVNSVWFYEWLLKHSVVYVSRNFSEPKFVYTLPSSGNLDLGGKSKIANMQTTFSGVISGLNSRRTKEGFFQGLALQNHWTMNFDDIDFMRKNWNLIKK
jgi:hypothetical protein